MYEASDLFLRAKLSVPVILYTTEQIFCAHYMVHVLGSWRSRRLRKEESCEASRARSEVDGGVGGAPAVLATAIDGSGSGSGNGGVDETNHSHDIEVEREPEQIHETKS